MNRDNPQNISHSNIDFIENFILGGISTPVLLGKNLQQLRNLRTDYYDKMIEKMKLNAGMEETARDEYNSYCKFITDLIRSKKLPNAILSRILNEFLNDYDIVRPLDIDGSYYQMTLVTLGNINATLQNSSSAIKNKQISDIDKLTKIFIKDNNPSDLPTK